MSEIVDLTVSQSLASGNAREKLQLVAETMSF